MYRQISKTWQRNFHEKPQQMREKAVELRHEPAVKRLERPTRLDRARQIGYRAKEGVIVVRIRVSRGGMRRKRPVSGRRSKHMGVLHMKADVSMQDTAERRLAQRFPNMKVLGSYPVWQDGMHAWFEGVLVDPQRPEIRKDYNYRRALGIVS